MGCQLGSNSGDSFEYSIWIEKPFISGINFHISTCYLGLGRHLILIMIFEYNKK